MKDNLSKKELTSINAVFSTYSEIKQAKLFNFQQKVSGIDVPILDIAVTGDKVNRKTVSSVQTDLQNTKLPYSFNIIAFRFAQQKQKNDIDNNGAIIYHRQIVGWQKYRLIDCAEINPPEHLQRGSLAKKITLEELLPFTKKATKYFFETYMSGFKFKNGDTVMARITRSLENGKTAFIDILDEDEVGFGSTEFIILRARKEIIDKHFLYYLVIAPELREVAILSMSGSSGRQRVQTDVIKNHLIQIPPLPEQKRIAKILSCLDEKIYLLLQQNLTLEQIIDLLFQKHFMGKTGKHWKKQPLSKFGKIVCGKTPSKKRKEYFDGDVPFVKIPDLYRKTFILETNSTLSKEGANTQRSRFIPPMAICVSCLATIGRVAMTIKQCQTNQQINSIIPYRDEYRYYIYLQMQASTDLLRAMADGGTATSHLNTRNFSKIEIALPPEELLLSFHHEVKPYFDKISNNQSQIATLKNLRDCLLPKLINGEITVKQ